MSRIPRENVWRQEHGNMPYALCPVCKTYVMVFDASDSWHREHIIHQAHGGPDIYPNLIPICSTCNLKSNSNKYYSLFRYMMVKGLISKEEAHKREQQVLKSCRQFEPICTSKFKNGNPCTRRKCDKRDTCCRTHSIFPLEPIDRFWIVDIHPDDI